MGMILYQLATGLEPYQTQDIKDDAFHKVKHSKIIELLTMQDRLKYVNQKMVSLISGLLSVRENERFDCCTIIEHEWLNLYYSKYKLKLQQKSESQSARNRKLHQKMEIFPYYKCLD